jgi:exopolysaccharide production protein ExoQ
MSDLPISNDLDGSLRRLPWGTYFFILLVILLIDPFDFAYSGLDVSVTGPTLQEFVLRISRGSIERRFGLFLLAVFGIFTFLKTRKTQIRIHGILGFLMLFYIVWAIFSVTWSDDVDLTIRRVGILAFLTIGAIALAVKLSPRQIIFLTVFISAITLIVSIIAEILLGTFSPFSSSWRFAGVLHPYGQARNCGLLAIASISLYTSRVRGRIIYLFISTLALLFLILTKSRVPFASALISLFSCLILASQKRFKLIITCMIFVIFTSSLAYLTFDKQINTLWGQLATFGRGDEGKESVSDFTGRKEIWQTIFRYGSKRPILGYGYNAYFTPKYLRRMSQEIGYVPSNVHNGYLETFFGLGLVGLVALISILLLSIITTIKISFKSMDYTFTCATLIWLCSLLTFESITLSRPTFPTLLCMTLLVNLGFVRKDV